MDKDTTITKVVFRYWNESNDVIALFPEIMANREHYFCESYEHIGQHSAADYDGTIRRSRLATPDEYADLKAELESIGYNLRVMQRRESWNNIVQIWRENDLRTE